MIELTLFTTCKPFKGESKTIQANALASWAKLMPACDILVFGNEEGVGEQCKSLGIRHIETVPRNEYGTPLLNGLFQAAERESSSRLLGFVNADIMLTSDLLPAVEHVASAFHRFLLISRRWNIDLKHPWDFSSSDWESQLREYALRHGRLEPVYGGIDLFIYPRGVWPDLPPFAIGRGRCDSALICRAVSTKTPVIDVTKVVTCVHQNHGYLYAPDATPAVFKGPEAERNHELLGGDECIFTALNATYVLSHSGIRRQVDLHLPHLLRRLATLPGQYAMLKPLAPIVRLLAPFWRRRTQRLNGSDAIKERESMAIPYPISIAYRPIASERLLPPGGGVETFDTPEAREINTARTEHLRSLDLPLKHKTVLDAGCGVGHLAQFFIQEGCDVLCVDGRQQNIDRLKVLYPEVKARVFDLEREPPSSLGRFDVVFAYGLLYHLENPFKAIRDLASVCNELLLLETVVVDHCLPVVRMQEETSTYSQALWGVGCRPSPSYVALALQAAGFEGIYAPSVAPNYQDFQFEWKNDLSDMRDGHLLRCIFVASRSALNHSSLVNLFAPSPC